MSMTKKGMSQTLALIVAASVLMMTALTVIFLAQGSLTNVGSDSDRQSCLSAAQSQCSAALPTAGGTDITVNVPQQCLTTDDAGDTILISNVGQATGQVGDATYEMPPQNSPDDGITCSTS